MVKNTYNFYRLILIAICAPIIMLSGCATQVTHFRISPSLNSDIRTYNGAEYISIQKFCKFYDADCSYDIFSRSAVIQIGNNRLSVRDGGGMALVNGELVKLDKPAMAIGNEILVPVSFVRADIGPMIKRIPAEPSPKRSTRAGRYSIRHVIVDAGHGGKDPGAIGRRSHIKEKILTLQAAKKLKSLLEEAGMKVTMTRDSDEFIPLEERSAIANRSQADIFVSIHMNSSRARSMRGFECYYLSNATDDNARAVEAAENYTLNIPSSAATERTRSLDKTLWDMTLEENRIESSELANSISSSINDSLAIGNRGVKTARFYVLKHTNLPSVLVEAGYISNKYEEIKLRDPEFLDRVVESVARGIMRFKERYEMTEGFTHS